MVLGHLAQSLREPEWAERTTLFPNVEESLLCPECCVLPLITEMQTTSQAAIVVPPPFLQASLPLSEVIYLQG